MRGGEVHARLKSGNQGESTVRHSDTDDVAGRWFDPALVRASLRSDFAQRPFQASSLRPTRQSCAKVPAQPTHDTGDVVPGVTFLILCSGYGALLAIAYRSDEPPACDVISQR